MSLNLAISILGILVVSSLAVVGGLVSTQSAGYRKIFWGLGIVGALLGFVQVYRQQESEHDFQAQVRDLKQSSEQIQKLQTENEKKQGEIKAKTEENVRLSNRITELTETAIKTVTGGDTFCYLHVTVGDDGLYPTVLSQGRYPLFDLSLRLWDPEEWKNAPHLLGSTLSKVSTETSRLGTLPSNDYINLGRLPLPTGSEKQYAAEFSARNGSWTQTIVLRRSASSWKLATIVQKSFRVAKAKELNPPRRVLCYAVEPGFPLREAGELRGWVVGNAHICGSR
jgi:hypothetical protein